jgi:hypothetical protein
MDARQVARKTLETELVEGLVDEELIPFLERLNDIPGVTTEYSCQGHKGDSSPNAYVILILDREIAEAFYLWRGVFIRDAPIPASLDFRYLQDKKGVLQERVWVNGDIDHIGEDCCGLFVYLVVFLTEISRMTKGRVHDGR